MDQTKKKVLVVDDEIWNNEIVQVILEKEFNVLTVTTPDECMNAIQSFYPDLIMLDIMMPGMNGFDLCRKLKSNPSTKNLRIIFVSASGSCSSRLQGYEAGADDFISKPFDHTELLAKVKVHTHLRFIEELDSLKTSILKLLCHETRTPLTGILGFATLLKEASNLTTEQHDSIDMIIKSGKQLQSIFNRSEQFLSLQKDVKLNLSEININDFVMSIIEKHKASAELKNIQFDIQSISDNNIKIKADLNLLHMALTCLMENAVEFSPEKESIKVKIYHNSDKTSFIISNKGDPIPDNMKTTLFNPLVAINIDNHSKGQNLGLPIASRIAQLHNGSLQAEDNNTNEVTFNFTIQD